MDVYRKMNEADLKKKRRRKVGDNEWEKDRALLKKVHFASSMKQIFSLSNACFFPESLCMSVYVCVCVAERECEFAYTFVHLTQSQPFH